MKRHMLYHDERGVANLVAYLFSFSIASMMMVSSVFITNGIVENKTNQIAGLEAQSAANKIAYGIIEAIMSRQFNSGSNYTKTLDIPLDLAGLNYYIEITDTMVYVNTSYGWVSKSCSIYNAGDSNIGISTGRISSGGSKIGINYEEPDYVYKFDFGIGNITSHSPVETGYNIMSPDVGSDWFDNDYIYRLPINISNPSSENLTDVPVKIVLNPRNFDYNHANVTIASSSWAFSDLIFYDPDPATTNKLPYYIDYWNADGESVVLVNISIENNSYKHIFLYYGYDGALVTGAGGPHNHTIGDVSLFYDDFNGVHLDDNKWYNVSGDPQGPNVTDGNITLILKEYIPSKNFEIPPVETPNALRNAINVSEAMYIVEAKMKVYNNTCCRIFLDNATLGSYQICAWCSSSSKLLLEKEISGSEELQNVTVPNLNHSLRWKSYVYHSKTCYNVEGASSFTDATYITSCIYDFNTFAYEGSQSWLDTDGEDDEADGAPIFGWTIWLANVDNFGPDTGKVIVDWIRVMKAPPVPLTVDIGPMESTNYSWTVPSGITTGNSYNSSNPFDPGPILSDFNFDSNGRTFEIQALPEGDYTITVTMGKYDDTCNEMTVQFEDSSGGSYDPLTIPATENGKFETKWYTIKDFPDGADLYIKFMPPSWTVNSIVIERGDKKGIIITGG